MSFKVTGSADLADGVCSHRGNRQPPASGLLACVEFNLFGG